MRPGCIFIPGYILVRISGHIIRVSDTVVILGDFLMCIQIIVFLESTYVEHVHLYLKSTLASPVPCYLFPKTDAK